MRIIEKITPFFCISSSEFAVLTQNQTVTTVIDGKVRMKDRELVGIDEREVLAKSREQAEKMWARINAR